MRLIRIYADIRMTTCTLCVFFNSVSCRCAQNPQRIFAYEKNACPPLLGAHVQGAFFNCSAQISVLKRKMLFNHRGSFVHQEYHGRESLIVCPTFFFHFGTENLEEQLKKAPCRCEVMSCSRDSGQCYLI